MADLDLTEAVGEVLDPHELARDGGDLGLAGVRVGCVVHGLMYGKRRTLANEIGRAQVDLFFERSVESLGRGELFE